MYARWPWWRAIADTRYMTVGKADMRVAGLYARLVDDEALRERMLTKVTSEFDRTCTAILAVVDRERSSTTSRSSRRRSGSATPVDLLHAIQIRLLRQFRAETDPARRDAIAHPLMLTISGIAAGLRNTAAVGRPRAPRPPCGCW